MSSHQKLRTRLKQQRDARMRSKYKQYKPYGVTLDVFDRVQNNVRLLYKEFPTLVPKQIEHFILNCGFESTAHTQEFIKFPPELKDHVCRPLLKREHRTNNQRVRDVIRSREMVDASGGDPKVAMKQHKILKEKFTQDFASSQKHHNNT